MKYYFFKTVMVDGRLRLRPIEGQTDENGKSIDTSLNVQGSKFMRERYPEGTVFGSTECLDQVKYYSTGALSPIGLKDEEYIMKSHKPSAEMLKAYQALVNTKEVIEPDLWSETPIVEKETKKKKETPKSASLYEKISKDEYYKGPTIDMDGFFVTEDNWKLLLRNILTGTNTMMIGPTGTGKTELIMLACRKLGIECNVYNMGTVFDPISELLGVHRLVGGNSVFDYAKFAADVQKPGVILLDELSRAPATTNNILFPCLDSRRTLPVDMAGGDDLRNISVHPECVFIATANIGSEYTGTMSMDRALVGRFFPIELDYMDEKDESKVLIKRYDIKKADADNIVKVASTVRQKYNATELGCSISTRETLMAAELIRDGWSAVKAMELTFLPLFEGTKVEGERSIVMQIILSR